MSYPPPPPGSDEPTDPSQQPPGNPYGAPQPEYGAPQPPADGQPPYGQPPYGQPPAYGQPGPYGQPNPYGQPPAGPGYQYGSPEEPKGKGLAITAFILAFVPCLNVVAFVLGLVVLIGKKGGKGLAIAAMVITPVTLVIGLALGVYFLASTPINDLEAGQCFTADGLAGDDEDVSRIEVVSCSSSHDGEVLAVTTLDADEAEGYADGTARSVCEPLIDPSVVAGLPADVTITSLTDYAEPDAGDRLACVVHKVDGSKLSEKLG